MPIYRIARLRVFFSTPNSARFARDGGERLSTSISQRRSHPTPYLNNWHRHRVRRSSKRSLLHVVPVKVCSDTLIALALAVALALALVVAVAVTLEQVGPARIGRIIRRNRLEGHVAAVQHADVVDDDRQSDTVEQALACSCTWEGGWALGAPRQGYARRAVLVGRGVPSTAVSSSQERMTSSECRRE